MSVKNENAAGGENVVLERPVAGGVYASLFEKINLNPVSELSALDIWQDAQAMCDRMRDVLREPAPDNTVVTCFQRVMMLGFLGSFRALDDPERQKLVKALSEHVAPFSYPQTHPVVVESRIRRGTGGWMASWPVRIGLSVVVVAALWWGLDHWLDRTLLTLLPGAVK